MPVRLVMRATALALTLLAAASVLAQETGERWLAGWPERQAKLRTYQAAGPQKIGDAAKQEVIRWLDRDAYYAQEHLAATNEGLGEAFGEYYISLVLFVTELKDPRSIRALSLAMDVAGKVSTTLAEFGDQAVEAVVAQSEKPHLRSSAAYTLGKFIQGRKMKKNHLSDAAEARIREVLLRLTRDEEPTVRQNAVQALGYFKPDAQISSAVRELAEHDPYARKRTEDKLPDLFPVRDAARRVLQKWERE